MDRFVLVESRGPMMRLDGSRGEEHSNDHSDDNGKFESHSEPPFWLSVRSHYPPTHSADQWISEVGGRGNSPAGLRQPGHRLPECRIAQCSGSGLTAQWWSDAVQPQVHNQLAVSVLRVRHQEVQDSLAAHLGTHEESHGAWRIDARRQPLLTEFLNDRH